MAGSQPEWGEQEVISDTIVAVLFTPTQQGLARVYKDRHSDSATYGDQQKNDQINGAA